VTHDQVEAMTMGHNICIMNEGKVVQMGRPLDVYRNPADTFVAKFLGNPPMNLLHGRLEAQDGRPAACFAGNAVALPKRTVADLGGHVGHDVIIGVRPEDLYETAVAGGPAEIARLPVRVVAVEPLGAETLLVVALDGSDEELIARIGRATDLRSGERLDIALDTAAIHLFDPATTRTIA
jgi:ABC-type sugar transport system ATPase subunit